jgi:hypothetical protein
MMKVTQLPIEIVKFVFSYLNFFDNLEGTTALKLVRPNRLSLGATMDDYQTMERRKCRRKMPRILFV